MGSFFETLSRKKKRLCGFTVGTHFEINGQPPWMTRTTRCTDSPTSSARQPLLSLSTEGGSYSSHQQTPNISTNPHAALDQQPSTSRNGAVLIAKRSNEQLIVPGDNVPGSRSSNPTSLLSSPRRTPSCASRRASAVSAATEDALQAMSVQEHYELGYVKTGVGDDACVRGSLTFALRYDFIHRVLMVHVLNCQQLVTDKDADVDPYIKMYLLPERRHHSKTKMHKSTASPEFNEMFSFDVAYNALVSRMLQFNIFDFDRFSRHDLIGNVIMRDLFEKSDLFNWTEYTMQVTCSNSKNDFGDLLVYLSYSRPDRILIVTVAKAYNLRPMDITGASDPYIKIEQVYQNRRMRKRRTTTKRANLNPVYHETLEFEMEENQTAETFLLVQVIDWDRIGKDDLLGCCILGTNAPTAEGRDQWKACFAITPQHNSSRTNTDSSNDTVITNLVDPLVPPIDVSSTANLITVTPQHQPVRHSVVIPKPKAVGKWHSLLPEIPDEFCSYSKKH